MNEKQKRILNALLIEHLGFTSLVNVFNDWKNEDFSMPEIIDEFSEELSEGMKYELMERWIDDNPDVENPYSEKGSTRPTKKKVVD